MNPKFDINKFEEINNDELLFECENCRIDFLGTKKNIKRVLGITKNTAKCTLKFCSKKCSSDYKKNGHYFNCSFCNKEVYKTNGDIKKNKKDTFFCNSSCNAKYWNKNKNYGFNRSKIEIYIEDILVNRYNFEILFNDRTVLDTGYELDIYIPHLKLSFEINGIFHYEEIFGNLKVIQNKDISKINECIEKNIELITIDISDISHFNKIIGEKYITFITTKIDEKLGNEIDTFLYKGEKKIIENNNTIKYCTCGKEIKKTSLKCNKCKSYNNRKVERPTYQVLLNEIDEIGYKEMGIKYGVDRTTIYKWKIDYERKYRKGEQANLVESQV